VVFLLYEGSGGVVLVLLSVSLVARVLLLPPSSPPCVAGRRGCRIEPGKGLPVLRGKGKDEVRDDYDTAAVRLEASQQAERMTHMEEAAAALRFALEVKTAA